MPPGWALYSTHQHTNTLTSTGRQHRHERVHRRTQNAGWEKKQRRLRSRLAEGRGERERERRRRGASTEMRNEEQRCAAASSRWGGHDERPSPPVARARETGAVRREVRSSVAP